LGDFYGRQSVGLIADDKTPKKVSVKLPLAA
jgi:hypothetical protein